MKFNQRTIRLIAETQRTTAISMINNAPVGQGLELVLRETPKVRGLDANALMWAGPLKDIAEQAWENNRQYSTEAWHEVFKLLYMPDENDALMPYLFEHVKDPDKYHKFDMLPNGERRCVASTTDLTKYGFSQYLEQIFAFGAEKGVVFHTVKQS